ncbi:hypothetical protein [Bernardetia sp. MNP-M8]|uniref:hypothetical protein n=1 Tax=Bernardetia sp. MNP-M8 TaxID=3127470 RepID=UPI0030CB9FA0
MKKYIFTTLFVLISVIVIAQPCTQDGSTCISPVYATSVTIRGTTYAINSPISGYEEGKLYAFHLAPNGCINGSNDNQLAVWTAFLGVEVYINPQTFVQAMDNYQIVVRIRSSSISNGGFRVCYNIAESGAGCNIAGEAICFEGDIVTEQPPIDLGICTELCPGVGLKSTGFEGDESGWKYNVAPLNGEVYSDLNLNLTTNPSPEHTIIDEANYNSFFNSNQGYNPFTSTNQKVLALGHGDTRDANGVSGQDYYQATIEQTFFVGENYEPKLDIWYSWVAEVAPEGFNEKPIFSIKLFRFYEDRDSNGKLILLKEEVYSHIDTQTTFDHKSTDGKKIWRHWWDKKTIDLTPYKLERLHIEITSYDKQGISRDYKSMAFVDVSCSTCCTPLEVANNATQSLTIDPIVNGIVNIHRPRKICEGPEEPNNNPYIPFNESGNREACNPTFFYQIIDPNGEPYVMERQGREVTFRPTIAGQYQIRYKEDSTCCWSDFQEFAISGDDLIASDITFSNDLKSAAISCIPSFEMDEVLAVNVASFGDRQLVDPKDIITSNRKAIATEVAVTEPKNPYLTGERGIWRTEASYAYVTDRGGYEEDREMNAVKEGGTFGLNMFNWTTQGVVPENWRRVNHVSRYDGYTHEIENRDILGRYSSALYGYNGQLATAVASNAAYYEIANEGFDAYQLPKEDIAPFVSCSFQAEIDAGFSIRPYTDIIQANELPSGETLSLHSLGYIRGKYYAFRVQIPIASDCPDINWQWSVSGDALKVSTENKFYVIIQIPNQIGTGEFRVSQQIFQENCDAEFENGGSYQVCGKGFVKSEQIVKTETNFEINNLYKDDGDNKDRNVILQVLWAKGDKGVLEGYTPGEGATVTLDASVLAYTIGKQGAMDITPNLSVNAVDNEYIIDEKVQITLRHRDATTSWFTIEPKGTYQLPEEWMQKEEQWYGSVRLARTLPRIGNTNTPKIDKPRNYEALVPVAHTGNQGLVPSEDIIIQEKLLLIPGKEYVFSAWVKLSTSEDQPYTYGTDVGAALSFYENGSNAADQYGSILFPNPAYDPINNPSEPEEIRILKIHPTGAIIEGWQRIEGTFVVPTGSMFTGVYLKSIDGKAVYDDVRIYPANGMMKTYVYNPSNYLLQAVLDENNYATLYYYDEEQRLYLVQKETREGVQTIQETRSYIKPLLPQSVLNENDGE